jgi:hypothetical protein
MTISRSDLKRTLALALPLVLALPVLAGAQAPTATSHTVKKGDTLWDISRTYLGDPFLWPQIYKVNTDVVKDPHWIYPGQVLRLEAGAGVQAVPNKDTPPPPPAAATPPEAQVALAPGITVVGPSDQTEEEGMELFRRRRVVNLQNAFKTYREVKDHPLRPGEFFAAGFLSEGDTLPFGALLGPVTPEQIETSRARAAVQILTKVAVTPPAGAHYAIGDTLLIVDRREGPVGYGEIVAPSGLIRITGENGGQTVGDVVAVFATIREGQSVLPSERFADPGAVKYQAVSGGLEGHILVSRDVHELRHPQQVLFIDIGKSAGVTAGDLFEARRTPGPQTKAAADAVEEVMATLQVIHVRDRTATVKVINVISPDVPIGTRIKQVAKLPG